MVIDGRSLCFRNFVDADPNIYDRDDAGRWVAVRPAWHWSQYVQLVVEFNAQYLRLNGIARADSRICLLSFKRPWCQQCLWDGKFFSFYLRLIYAVTHLNPDALRTYAPQDRCVIGRCGTLSEWALSGG